MIGAAIDRVTLMTRLDDARRGRVTVVQAPAGYGKSHLLVSWTRRLRRQGIAVAWPVLPDDPSDPNHFLAALVVAVAEAIAVASPPAGRPLSATPRFAARRLATIVKEAAEPLVIIIDDYDRISA